MLRKIVFALQRCYRRQICKRIVRMQCAKYHVKGMKNTMNGEKETLNIA